MWPSIAHDRRHTSVFSADSKSHHCRPTAVGGRVPFAKLRGFYQPWHQDSQPDGPGSPCSSTSSALSSEVINLPDSLASPPSSAARVDASSTDSHHMRPDHTQQMVLDDTDAVSAGFQTQQHSSASSAEVVLPSEQKHSALHLPPALNTFR